MLWNLGERASKASKMGSGSMVPGSLGAVRSGASHVIREPLGMSRAANTPRPLPGTGLTVYNASVDLGWAGG